MRYYTALWHDDYWGLTNIGEHTSLKSALASIRRKMPGTSAEAGLILDAKPSRDTDDDWIKAHEIGIVNKGTGPRKKNSVFPTVIYIYFPRQKYGRHNVKKLVMSDGSLRDL